MAKQKSDYILCLSQWNGTTKDFIDEYGLPVFEYILDNEAWTHMELNRCRCYNYWQNEVDGLRDDQDALNEFYRQFPRTEQHAFRDETKNSIFNLAKIYEQIDYNEELNHHLLQGNFQWVNGVKDTRLYFTPDANGRFKVSWIPNLNNKTI